VTVLYWPTAINCELFLCFWSVFCKILLYSATNEDEARRNREIFCCRSLQKD